jgi:hypothetical protein
MSTEASAAAAQGDLPKKGETLKNRERTDVDNEILQTSGIDEDNLVSKKSEKEKDKKKEKETEKEIKEVEMDDMVLVGGDVEKEKIKPTSSSDVAAGTTSGEKIKEDKNDLNTVLTTVFENEPAFYNSAPDVIDYDPSVLEQKPKQTSTNQKPPEENKDYLSRLNDREMLGRLFGNNQKITLFSVARQLDNEGRLKSSKKKVVEEKKDKVNEEVADDDDEDDEENLNKYIANKKNKQDKLDEECKEYSKKFESISTRLNMRKLMDEEEEDINDSELEDNMPVIDNITLESEEDGGNTNTKTDYSQD